MALGLLALLVLATIISALLARHGLLAAQSAMHEGRSKLLDGEASSALRSFDDARARFDAVGGGPVGLVLETLRWVPGIGHTPKTTLAIADAGSGAAQAGGLLAGAVAEIPGGLTSLSPANGGISIDRLEPLTDAVVRAEGTVTEALMTVEASPDSLLIGPVHDARELLGEELDSLRTTLHSGRLLLQGLPEFLGAHRARRYFFAAQDPAELRGTGGVIGAYSILTIEDGRFEFARFRPIQSLPIPALEEVPPPSAEYATNYDQFRGGERFWLAINLTPDFPTAATAILEAYEVAEATRLDGVIFADPFALRALLRVAGPTEIPELGIRVTAANVVPLTTNEAFSLFPDPSVRKRVLGSIASDVFDGLVNGPQPSLEDLRILGGGAAEGHILVYSSDSTMEEGLRGTSVGGALGRPSGDFLSVVENSAGANKVDFYQDRSVSYTVDLGGDGWAHATADVRLTNHAPTTGQPGYVIGPRAGISKVGESRQLMNVYCGTGCRLESARRDGSRIPLWSGTEVGYPFYQDYYRTPSGDTSDLALALFLPQAWERDGSGGVYRLTFVGQTTIRPTMLRIEVRPPVGTDVTSASPSMQIEGGSAVWAGVPPHRLELEVTFSS